MRLRWYIELEDIGWSFNGSDRTRGMVKPKDGVDTKRRASPNGKTHEIITDRLMAHGIDTGAKRS